MEKIIISVDIAGYDDSTGECNYYDVILITWIKESQERAETNSIKLNKRSFMERKRLNE